MDKLTITGAGKHVVPVARGATIYFAASGTYTATITVKYATAPGVFVDFATPVTLSDPGEKTVINVGAHAEMQVECSAYTSGTATIIANPQIVQEKK